MILKTDPEATKFVTGILCYADLETKSECDLKAHGTARYAEHPSTDIQLFSYAFGEGAVKVWSKEDGEVMPEDLRAAFVNPKVIFWYHNSWFDRNVIENVLKIKLPIQRYRCSMATALSHGLPAALDKCGEVLGIREDARKIKDGKRLVFLFCKPKKQKDGSLKWATPQTHPEDWKKYKEYCQTDVIAMREIVKKIPKWNYPYNKNELELWYLDQTVNSRGMYIDLELANTAMAAITITQADLAKSTKKMTDGDVDTAGQRDEMLKHILFEYGIELPNMQKATLQRLVENEDIPAPLRELLEVRLRTCTTSTAKYKKIVLATSADRRLRGTIQFSGASRTQRDAGRVTQVQNYPSKNLMPPEDTKEGIDALKNDTAYLLGYDIMWLTSSALRYTIFAPEGKKLVVSDLANIEGRILAYLAGETWKIQAFKDFDAGTGPDLYKLAYAKAFGIHHSEVTKAQRNFVGKILELSLGYMGGCGAIVTFATAFGLILADLADQVRPAVPPEVLKEAASFYEWLKGMEEKEMRAKAKAAGTPDLWAQFKVPSKVCSLPPETHAPIESLKRLWRREHPATVALWKAADEACRNAVFTSGVDFHFGKCSARRSGKWVRITLPSGHVLCYPGMRVAKNNDLVFKGIDQFTKKWGDITTSPGKLVENCTQALARDVFKYGQLEAERRGYKVIMPLHDELVCEVPDTEKFTVHGLEQLMAEVPPWAEGLPLQATGFEDYRYHK